MANILSLAILILSITSLTVKGYPELGFLAKLPSDIVKTSSGWSRISGWVTSMTGVKGLYNFETEYSSDGSINITVSGLFFVSVSIPVTNADVGSFKAALIINDITADSEIALQSQLENTTSGEQMLSYAGFITLRAGERVSAYVYSAKDKSWTVKSQSSITFHFFGNYGSSPGFLVSPGTSRVLVNPSNYHITSWSKSGRAGLFQSLTGLTISSGKFTTVCTGVNILTANIIFEGGPGTYSVSTVFNGKSSIAGSAKLLTRGIITLNVYQSFFLPKASSVFITVTSNAGSVTVLSQSTWSMAYIGGTSSDVREFASFLRNSITQTSTSWSELTGLLRTSATQTLDGSDSGQLIQPSNLVLSNDQNFVMNVQTDLYYGFVHLVYSGSATNIESMIAVSADKTTATGKEGVYGSFTKIANETRTMSLAGIFHVKNLEHLSVFIKPNAPVTVHNTSFTSFVRMRYVVSAFGARIQTKFVIQKSGWTEITGPWLTENSGKFSYGTDFSASTGRFTSSQSGVYVVAANIQINNGQNAEIAIILVKNGVIDVNNGFYTVNGEPSSVTTLNMFGSISVKTGDVLSLYAYRGSSSTWDIDVDSGFSMTYIGPNWAALGFHAVIANDIAGTIGRTEIDGWTTNSSANSMTYANGQPPTSIRYTASVDGIYIVSANILVKNVSHSGAINGYTIFDLQAYVDGLQTNSIGLADLKPGPSGSSRDYCTLSFSGNVRMLPGQYLSLFLVTVDTSYIISRQSGLSVVLVSDFKNPENEGFLGTKNVASYLTVSAVNTWTRVADLETSLLPGQYQTSIGVTLRNFAELSVTEPGLFYISANIRFDNAGDGTLFEIHAEIDSRSDITYGMYAVEGSPRGIQFNLNFGGVVALTAGQNIRVMVRTAKNGYVIAPGSSFSIVKLQLDQRFPGIVVDKTDASFVPNQVLRSWEEIAKPGLFTSNVGFNAPLGTYNPPVSGVYIASINNYLGSITGNSSVSMIEMDNQNAFKAYGSEGVNRTKLATSAVYLNSNHTYKNLLNSSASGPYPMEAGWSLYYINPMNRITGFAGPLGAPFTVSSSGTWTVVTGWNGTSSATRFSTVSPPYPDEYTATIAGLHFVSFLPVFGQIASPYDIKLGVYINQALSLYASMQHEVVDQLKSIPISGTVKLNIGDVVSFRIHSSIGNLQLTEETTRSLLFVEGITTNTEGAAAYLPTTQTASFTMMTPYKLKNFVPTMPGGFLPQNETLDASGHWINFHAGVFLYTANIIVKNTMAKERVFHLYAKLDNENDVPVSLQSIKTIPGSSEETLSFSSSMFLPRFSKVQTFMKAADNSSFEIVANSTITFVLIDDNTGPVLCEDTGLNLEALNPSLIRISTEKKATFTCTVVGSIPATLSWFRNGVLIPGATTSTYTIPNTQISDSAKYHCFAAYRTLTATTNNGTLSVYDPTPVISATSYSVSYQENLPANSIMMPFTVSADKYAISEKAYVSGNIVSGDPNGDFTFVNASKSVIRLQTTRPLDHERRSFYQLSITAVNIEEAEARNTTIIFNITVIDVNDNGPEFNPSLIRRSVPENLPVGSPVLSVAAVDPDSGFFGQVNYSIISNLSKPFFSVNSSTGEVKLEKALDRETEDIHILIIEARDTQFSSIAEIVLNVTDVNDNQPRFNPDAYSLTIVENMRVGSSIIQTFASDPDLVLNSTLVYSILSGNTNEHFSLDNQTGIVSLVKSLDFETNRSFTLLIGLRDMGSPVQQSSNNATITINIEDINDNYAHFEQSLYSRTILETTAVGTSVLQVAAIDRDGTTKHSSIVFSINQTLASKIFQVDPVTGWITVKSKLDYETTKEYHFSVIATDNGTVPYQRHTNVIVYISDVNDEVPYFMPTTYNVSISEFSRPAAMVLKIFAYDNDTRWLQYSITAQSPKNDFRIDSSTGALYVANYLDRENISSYSLAAQVSDGANVSSTQASITLIITDENDNRPVFTRGVYDTSLAENSSVGTFVVTVLANDNDIGSNAAITYSIFNSGLNDSSLLFNINSTTGRITLKRQLDYEIAKEHSFIVAATDDGRVPLVGYASVLVRVMDANDNAPYFEPAMYAATIPESANIDNVVAVITARDNDTVSNQLSYTIVGGNMNNDFKLQTSISTTLLVANSLDYERNQTYTISIRAFDGLYYSSNNASVVVSISDVNDNNPIFRPMYYSVSIPENTSSTHGFLQVSATDGDGSPQNNQLTYTTLDNTTDFTLNSTTGIIYASSIDYERKSHYSLVVIASDNGSPPRIARAFVDITINDVNDNPPAVSPLMYHVNVSEAALLGLQLTQVQASDRDMGLNGQLVYTIVGGNSASKFRINADTGAVYLSGSLDFEGSVRNYTLTIAVEDRGGLKAASNATINIQVFDINDNQPIFDLSEYVVTIPENTVIGTSLVRVHASDNDGTAINSNMTYFIVSTTDAGNFTINSTTGAIHTSQAFDYEALTRYAILVEARDTGNNMLSGRSLVIVQITDINDNSPVPDMHVYRLNISTSIFVGTQVLTVFSSDRDSGINSRLQYTIINGDPSNYFSISNQGVLTLAKELNAILYPSYNLTIRVSDQGSPPLSSTFAVLIKVTELPTSAIAFERRQYIFNVNENHLQSFIGEVRANDTGNITSAYINYDIVANLNQMQGYFHLNARSGGIYMNTTTNYEKKKQYDFTVRAANNLGNVAYTHVTIVVVNINEAPYFVKTVAGNYTFNVSESVPAYSFVHSVHAMDNDTGADGQLLYSLILPVADQNAFIIDQNGRLYTKSALDYETKREYHFQVFVQDGGTPSLNATAYVNVVILDYNDNHPVFASPTPDNITVDENTASGTQIGTCFATDADTGSNAQIEYSVYPAGIATINRTTGILFIENATYIDYERAQFYDLIVVAKDKGSPHLQGTKTIRLFITNINDNTPYYITSSYNISVLEITPVGTMLLPLHALDNDLNAPGVIASYEISSGDTSKFRVGNDGQLYLNGALQFKMSAFYSLTITATDGGSPNRTAQATVDVYVKHVSRQQPVFLLSTYYKTVSENMNVNTTVLQVNASSAEAINGPLAYSIISNNISQYFSIDNSTGVIRNLISFDYEMRRSYTFTVQVLDTHNQRTGTAHVIITVTDLNDNTPAFTNVKHVYNISEATHTGALIASLSAADNDSTTNAMIQYYAVGGDGMSKFTVETDGEIYLQAPVDSKAKSSYTLVVKAQDMGAPSLHANLTLTINILAVNLSHLSQPSFNQSSYTAYVNEGITVSPLLTVLVTNQAISSSISYSIIGSASETGPFTISANGSVSLVTVLDYEVKRLYRFTVRATNSEGRTADAPVTVHVLDTNDNLPYFSPAVYTREISEFTPAGQTILHLIVKDNDTMVANGPYRYSIIQGNTNMKFTVTSSGYLRLASKIDYDTMVGTSFTLIVSVSEGGNYSISNATVTINIRNENDLRPVFTHAIYTFNVSENAAIGYSLGMLNATDSDRIMPSNQISYSLVTTSGDFALSSFGNLTVNRSLNYESVKNYELVAVAMDAGSPSLRATAIIKINVIDVNEERPYFKSLSYTVNISEAFPVGSTILTVTAYDDDTGAGGIVTYSISDPTSTFGIHPSSGAIMLSTALNYEARQNFSVRVSATDGGGNAAVAPADVFISVTEVNDNEPVFVPIYYTFNVREDLSLHSLIGQVSATDADRISNMISYSIVPNTDSGNFTVHSNGSITLAASLDYETAPTHSFLVKASDNGSPLLSGRSMVTVNVIDVSDNAPAFMNACNNNISEASPIGMAVLTCTATDKDAKDSLTYHINGSDYFTVDNNGVITLRKALDSKVVSVHNLTLTASDGVSSTSTTVRVYVSPTYLCRPRFNQTLYEAYVREDTHVTAYVLTVRAEDARNRTIVYSMQASVTDFQIDKTTGVISTKKLLSYQSKTMYIFKIYADAGSSRAESVVVIRIIDINNISPIPGQLVYTVQISEMAAIGAIVIGLNVSDPDTNTKLTYSIKSGNILNGFRIDQYGQVLVDSALDYELVPFYRLFVGISDGLHETNARVNIQVIDIAEPTTCSPCLQCPTVSTFDFSMPAYTAKLSENMTANSVIATVDLNQAAKNRLIAANYSIRDQSALRYFSINRTTGQIQLNSPLNTATLLSLSEYTFTVYNQFKCREAAAEIIVDNQLSGCPFAFSRYHYEATLPETYPTSQTFLTVVTTPVSASAVYSIVENAARTMFQINSISGGISLRTSLDYEAVTRHKFTVKVNVTNLISYVTVIVYVMDADDNCPQVTAFNGTYYQPVQQGAIVGRVAVSDADTFKNHTFAITGGDTGGNFSIDANGVVTARTVITSSNRHIFSLQIRVSDAACSKMTTMTVVVQKDVPPPCPSAPSCYNYTCAPCATTQPLTKCPDKFCPGCPICPTTQAPCPTTATTTKCPVKTCPTCPVTCPASVTCPVCPTLHCPGCAAFTSYNFKQPYYTVNVYENRTTPSDLLTVHINGRHRTVYSIVESQARTFFNIDSSSGKISLNSSLNYTMQKTHQFTVQATIGSESSYAIVVVQVLDVNDNCPVFNHREIYSRLTSPVENGTIIGINKATDADAAPALTYQITAGDTAGEFSIDNMGVIRARKRIIIAGSKTFNLTVSAWDGICTVTAKAIIVIHLDNMFTVTPSKCPVYCPPCAICTGSPTVTTSAPATCPSTCQTCLAPSNYVFGQSLYRITLNENTTYSNAILHVGLLSGAATANFSIMEARALDFFRVNRTTGEIFLTNVLDYESATQHNFTVQAMFAGGFTNTIPVIIEVMNINDNVPYFTTVSYTLNVHEFTEVGTQVVKVMATDADASMSVHLTIDTGNVNTLFSIVESTGAITLAKAPYLFLENTYVLKIRLVDAGGLHATTQATVTVNIIRMTAAKAGCNVFGNNSYAMVSVTESAPIGSLVIDLMGTPSAPGRTITYAIENNAAKEYFQINSTTGRVTTKVLLDHEKMASHLIDVSAIDQLTSIASQAIIVVNVTNVNDGTIVFTSPSAVSASEMSSTGAIVAVISAKDSDANSKISYHISSGNAGGLFSIDPSTGILRLNGSLNHDTGASHSVQVCAVEAVSGEIKCHQLTVNVTNENNKPTTFGQTSYVSNTPLNATVGAFVAQIAASDPDGLSKFKYSLSGAVANEYFSINETTGAITLKKPLSGAGLASPIVVEGCATDNGSPATTTCVPVIVNTGSTAVVAPNYFHPEFIYSQYNAVVNENATLGSTILTIASTDNDTGAAGAIHYERLQGPGNDYFTINGQTGEITNVKSLNTTTTPKVFFLTVTARDYGTPIKYTLSHANITIAVLSPSLPDNTIVAVGATTMSIELSKEPFDDPKVLSYQVVGQEYDPNVSNFESLSAMHAVSWFYVNFVSTQYHHRRFIIADVPNPGTVRRKRRSLQQTATLVKMEVGTEKNCHLKSLESDVCNGPLAPGKTYRFQLVGYYASNSPVTGAFTNPRATSLSSVSSQTGVANSAYIVTYWIIGLVVLSLMFFLAILVIVVIFCYKRKYRVYDAGPKTFINPVYTEQRKITTDKENLNFYASDAADGYQDIGSLKEEMPHSHAIEPEELELVDQQPISATLGATNTFSNYETISNKLTFDEENPEWVSMDISLKVDPTGQTDPVIITKGERTSENGSTKKGSVSSDGSKERAPPAYPRPDYDSEQASPRDVRMSIASDDGFNDIQGITKL